MERVREAKVLPPVLPEVLIDRPRVAEILADAVARRLTAVIAPAGFGKSTLLAGWADDNRCAWYTLTEDDSDLETLFRGVVAALRLRVTGLAEAVRDAGPLGGDRGPEAGDEEAVRASAHAAHLSRLLEGRMSSPLLLVLDDVHELAAGSASSRFVESLCRQAPRQLHLVLLSRDELPFPIARLRAQGQAVEIDASVLAFDESETVTLAAQVAGDAAADAARRLHETTLGWPAAIRLGMESLRNRAHLPVVSDDDALAPDDIIDLLAGEVFDRADAAVTSLVATVAPLDGFTAELAEALGVAEPSAAMGVLQRGGLLRAHGALGGWYSLHPLVQHWARRHLPPPVELADLLGLAAQWMRDAGHPRQALALWDRAGADHEVAALLADRGGALVADGAADEVLRHLAGLPADARPPELLRLEAEAYYVAGDWEAALDCVDRFAGDDVVDAAVAWRAGLIHYHRGDLDRALAFYDRAAPEPEPSADRAMVDALAAAVWWLRGDFDRCRTLAEQAHQAATALGHDRSLAAAHTALAMLAAVSGDRRTNDAHYLRALTHAEAAGDVLQLIRIHTNRGSRYLEECDYADALAETDAAIETADLAGYAMLRALALTNRGEILYRMGRLDEAMRDLTAARIVYERAGSHNLAYPLTHIGDIHALRNESSLAAAAYEEAIGLSAATGDVQGQVPALVGLSRLLVASDPDRAAELADRAAAAGPMLGHPHALLAQGWVALTVGDPVRARDRAAAAAAAARSLRDRAGLAGAVELQGHAAADPDEARDRFAEAASSWAGIGHVLDEARVRVVLGRFRTATVEEQAAATRARTVLLEAGARRDVIQSSRGSRTGLSVASATVLGPFRVRIGDRTLGPTDWGSRKPRDLLKVVIANGGHVRREVLLDVLWPDDDRAHRKLSVALSTVRSLLDPGHQFDQDHFLAADRDAVWLPADHWDIDLTAFLTAAAEGLRLVEVGDERGIAELTWVESTFDGDPFDEDAYEEWAIPVRDQASTLMVSTVRALAGAAVESGTADRAVRLLLRLLERDPYDEQAHRQLIGALRRAGRHGEARRMYQTYCERMEEIGVEPASYPQA